MPSNVPVSSDLPSTFTSADKRNSTGTIITVASAETSRSQEPSMNSVDQYTVRLSFGTIRDGLLLRDPYTTQRLAKSSKTASSVSDCFGYS